MKLNDFNYVISGADVAGEKAKSANEKPWLIFIHGLLGSLANWRRITPVFEDRYQILTFDQRGHGKSFKPKTGYAPEDYAGDLKFLMDELQIPRADIVGHSMGGRNAQCFAALYPERVLKLVIEDIGPEGTAKTGSEVVQRLRNVQTPFKDKRAAKEFLLNEFGNPKLGGFLYTSLKELPDGKAIWNFDMQNIIETIEKGRAGDRWSEIKNLKCPTLVIRGEHSDELAVEEFEKMQKINPLVTGVQIAGAGHWVHFDKPQEFIGILQKFLKA